MGPQDGPRPGPRTRRRSPPLLTAARVWAPEGTSRLARPFSKRSPQPVRKPGLSADPGRRPAPASESRERKEPVSKPGQQQERLRIQTDDDVQGKGDPNPPRLPPSRQAQAPT